MKRNDSYAHFYNPSSKNFIGEKDITFLEANKSGLTILLTVVTFKNIGDRADSFCAQVLVLCPG